MGRSFAAVMGLVAYAIVIMRAVFQGSGLESTVKVASLSLFAFAALGYVLGRVADATVVQSVEAKFRSELKAKQAADNAEQPKAT